MPDSRTWALWEGGLLPALPVMAGCAPRSSHRPGAVQRGSLTEPVLLLLLLRLVKRLLGGWCMCLCAGQQAQGVDGAGTIAVLPSLGLSPPSAQGTVCREGVAAPRDSRETSLRPGVSQHQVCMRAAPGAARSDHGYQQGGGDRQCCQCRCPEHLVVLCCPLGQAAGTLTDASANFTDSMKEEAARGLAAQQVSRGSATPGTGLAEPGFAPPPNCVPAPWETSLSPSVFVPLEQPPGPQRKWGH